MWEGRKKVLFEDMLWVAHGIFHTCFKPSFSPFWAEFQDFPVITTGEKAKGFLGWDWFDIFIPAGDWDGVREQHLV